MTKTAQLPGAQTGVRRPAPVHRGAPKRSALRALALGWLLLLPGIVWAGLTASVTLQSGAPTNIRPSELTTLEITLANNNSLAAINNVALSNSLPGTLPNGLLVAGAATYTCLDPVAGTTAPGSGTLTAAIGTQAIQLAGGIIPARNSTASVDGACTIRIPVTAGSSNGTGTAYTYTILGGAVTGNDGSPVANIGNVSQSVNVTAIAQPQISKLFSNATAILGGASRTLTLTISNANPIPISDFSITDTFPTLGAGGAVIQVAATPAPSSTCTAGGTPAGFVGLAAGATSITASGGTVPANGSCTLSVAIVGRQTNGAFSTGARTNTINAVSDFTNAIGIRAQANATANITVTSPLGVNKTFSPGSLADNQTGTMTITLTNSGDSPLIVQGFTDSPIDGIGDTDPALGIKVNGAIGVSCTGAGVAGTYAATTNNVGITQTASTTIAAGGSCTISVPVLANTMAPNTPVTYTNTIAAGAVDVGDPAIVSQGRTATILVADTLRVLKSSNANAPRPGNPVQYLVTVQNWTTAPMSDVLVTDALENGMTFLTGTIAGRDYTPLLTGTGCSGLAVTSVTGDATARFTIGSIPARSSVSSPGACTVAFYVMTATNAAQGSSTRNNLPAGQVCTGAGTCNGGAAASADNGVSTAVLQLAKAFNPAGPLAEGTVTRMTITLSNYSVNPLANVSISDTLPISGTVQMQVATPANAATTCGGTITAAAGSTSVALNGGTVPARANGATGAVGAGNPGSCTLQVDVVAAAGAYTNTATAAGTETYADGTTHLVGPLNANASISFNSILTASKTFNPASVSSGGRSTVTVRLANSAAVALANVRVIDPLPAGMVLATPTNAYTTCDGGTGISGAPGASSITLQGATIAGGGTCDFRFDVVATGSASWSNAIPPGNILAVGTGVTNQTPVTGTLAFNAGNALTVAKATNPSTLSFPGQPSRLTITITNGATAVSGLSLTDHFTLDGQAASAPNGMVVAANPQTSTTCSGGTVTAAPGATSITLSGAAMAASSVCTVAVNVTTNRTGGITNFIPVGAIRTEQALSNALQATTSLTAQTNIGVVKQFIPPVIKPGQRSRLRLTFYNGASQPASNLSVVDNLPAGVTVPLGPDPVTTCTGAIVSAPTPTQVQVNSGALAAAAGGVPASCYAEIDVTATAEGSYTNTIPASALSATIGGTPVTNADPATAVLSTRLPVVIHKAIGGFTLDAGNPAGFNTGEASRAPGLAAPLVLRLANPNAVNLTEAALTDALPAGLVVAVAPNASTTCAGGTVLADPSALTLRLTGATIPANGSCTVSVDVLSNIAGTYDNQIASGALTTFEGVRNEEPTSARLVVTSLPGVGKQLSPPVIIPGGISRLTIVIDNDNSVATTLTANLTDTLPTSPAAMVVATPNNVSTTCPGGVGVVQAAPGSPTVRVNSGAVIPRSGCRVEVDVTAPAPGAYNNNIPVGGLQTTFGTNQQPANATLLVSTLGYISGKVFLDNLAPLDGVHVSGTDTPVAGVQVQLKSGTGCAGATLFTTHTDALGNYLFAELPAGTYTVCQPLQPAGTLNSAARAGSIVGIGASTGTAGSASNPTATTSQIAGIVLGNDGGDPTRVSGSPGNDFSEVLPVSIAGKVYLDLNNDGVQQGADPSLAGVALQLTGNDWLGNPVSVGTLSDGSGQYLFANLPPPGPGGYSVTEPTQPPSTNNGITTAGAAVPNGTAGTATGPATLPSRIAGIVLPPGSASVGNDFAEIPNDRGVFGRVFRDFDDNGLFNGTDTGIGGQVIQLTGNDLHGNPVSRTTTTQSDGTFAFTALPESDAAGFTLTQPAQPPNTQSGLTSPGTTGGSASPRTVLPSTIAGLNLAGANTISADNLFGEIDRPTLPPAPRPVVIHKAIGGFTLDAGNPAGFNTGEASRAPGLAAPLVLRLANPNAVNLTEAALTDALPAGLVVAVAPNASTTCAGGTVLADPSALTLRLTGATIPANGSCTVSVDVLSNIAGTYDNQIASGALTTFEGVRNEEPTSARLVVTSLPGVGKQLSPPVIIPGGISRLTIVIDNDNSVATTLTANLTDTLPTSPAAMVVATPNNVSTTCPGGVGVVQAAPGSPTVRVNSGAVIPRSGCRVEVDVTAPAPGAYNNNIPVGGLQTTFGTNQQPANATLLVSTLGYISGKVFLDNLAPLDGVHVSGTDTPVAGVQVQLKSGTGCAGATLFTTHTDALGNYLFAELPAGTYTVCQPLQPAGTLNSAARAGSIVGIGASTGTAGSASNPTATTSQIAGIVLGNDGGDPTRVSGSPGNDFSEVLPVSIAGKVYLDLNNDGVQQGADPSLAGVALQLTGNDWLGNPVSVGTLSDGSGQYLFANLPPPGPGGYSVTEPTQPPSTNNGITTAGAAVPNGTAGTATGPATLPSRIAGIVLPPGSASVGNDFAEIPNDRGVFGRVFRDFDDNGLFNGTDTGIGGQVIQLTGNDLHGNPVSRTTTTQSDGTFAFTALPESDAAGFTLTQPAQPPNTQSGLTSPGTTGGSATPRTAVPSTISGINLAGANLTSASNLFGEIDRPTLPPAPRPEVIPTLSQWSLMLLAALLALRALVQLRRRH